MAATSQISARVPDRLIAEIDRAARRLKRTRAEVVRQAIEYYLDDLEDLRAGLEALQDPADAVLDWTDVRRDLLGQD
ncbi:MAG: ribbon-helix-helix protein, CopG family [Thermoanaerobaculia bacterium]